MVALVAPFAPHMSEQLWHDLGHDTSVHRDSWPKWDDTYIQTNEITIIVQVNGKLRAKLSVANDTSEEDVKTQALNEANVVRFLDNKKPTKVIYVPGRLVSIVI